MKGKNCYSKSASLKHIDPYSLVDTIYMLPMAQGTAQPCDIVSGENSWNTLGVAQD